MIFSRESRTGKFWSEFNVIYLPGLESLLKCFQLRLLYLNYKYRYYNLEGIFFIIITLSITFSIAEIFQKLSLSN